MSSSDSSLWTRCGKCKTWWIAGKVAIKRCSCCTFITYRCPNCDGLNGAYRSVLAHLEYWAHKGGELGGHTKEALAAFRRVIPKEALAHKPTTQLRVRRKHDRGERAIAASLRLVRKEEAADGTALL